MSVKSLIIQCSVGRFGRGNGEREMRSKVGEGKIYSLSYADDMMLMAENEERMKAMIAKLERKKLKINVKKTKIMVFKKGGGRRKKMIRR